jgi:Ca2+-binding RTX toxin-like protein
MVVRTLAVAAAATLVGGIFGAFTASVSVPASARGSVTYTLSLQEIAPSACAGIALQDIVVGSGNFSGTPNNDLILGSSGADTINGNGGADCMVGGSHGGAGNRDAFFGGKGNDVCIGDGAGVDRFNNCQTIVNP